MKIIFVIVFTVLCLPAFTQHAYQNANSIIVNSNYAKNAASIETSYEFNHFKLTGIYNLSNKIFLHSNLTLNVLQQRADKILGGLFETTPVILHNNDVGLGGGFGFQDIARVGKFNLQLVLGYDYENQRYKFNEKLLDANYNFADSLSRQNNKLYKLSANVNFSKSNEKYNVNYLLRLSYCKFTKYQYNNVAASPSNSAFAIVEPAVELDFKLLKSRNLFVVTQFGLSLPLSTFEYSYKTDTYSGETTTNSSDYLLDLIFKLGLKYNFTRK